MIELDGRTLTLTAAREVVFDGAEVTAASTAQDRVRRSRRVVEEIVSSGRPVYGINTGFGRLSSTSIPPESLADLQRNIVLSHAVGTGDLLGEEGVRALLLFRINSLLRGNSGIRLETLAYLIELLNRRIHPCVPVQGSVGSSGDLTPLAHLCLPLIGQGEAMHDRQRIDGQEALKRISRPPLRLAPKEGLALLNGTQFMSALGFLLHARGERLLRNAIAAAALSLEALQAFTAPFDDRLQQARPHPGQVAVAGQIRELLAGSGLVDTIAEDVQDAYSLRCIPQVLGPAHEALGALARTLEIEINSATDNPLVFEDGTVLSGGNFHGEVLGLALEAAAMALAEVGSIAERRIDRLLTSPGRGLPLFLVKEGGINSGLMLLQYTAASLVSENRILAHPALIDSIPTSGGKEDHNSLAPLSGRKGLRIIDNLERIVAIEYLCAAQALDLRNPCPLAPATREVYDRVRQVVAPLAQDRYLAPELHRLTRAVAAGEVIRDPL